MMLKWHQAPLQGPSIGLTSILSVSFCSSQAIPVLGCQLVRQQELAAVELVQQQHLYALRPLPLHGETFQVTDH